MEALRTFNTSADLQAGIMNETVTAQRNARRQEQAPIWAQQSGASVSSIQFPDAVHKLSALAKPEHIVSGLKVAKSVMPSLIKGIGAQTMEKWGAALIGKWIPYVGVAVTVARAL